MTNVDLTLFDVDAADRASFIDQVTFRTAGLTLTGSPDNVVSGNTVTGIARSPNLGAGSGAGNVTVRSGGLPLTEIVFDYTSPGSLVSVLHGIGLGPISFTPVPEVHQLAIGLLACAIGAFWLRRTARRKPVSVA
ncbi:MAG: hypothetical protein JO069_11765 [Verrucomicrobia bacterium]|nr:hypothetical protein [Verrucomicrobiota bacterium]